MNVKTESIHEYYFANRQVAKYISTRNVHFDVFALLLPLDFQLAKDNF